jgi:hypothetical protein
VPIMKVAAIGMTAIGSNCSPLPPPPAQHPRMGRPAPRGDRVGDLDLRGQISNFSGEISCVETSLAVRAARTQF